MSISLRLITVARAIAVSGLIGGAALGLAGAASAAVTFDDNGGMIATPDTYATPATTYIPWGAWIQDPGVMVPQVDNTVAQSR
jgi:hypothetical protein